MNKHLFVFLGLILTLVAGLATACGGAAPGTCEIENARLEVGDPAPDFRLMDHTGRYVRLSDFRGTHNVIIAFYPLAWTPV
ncbi:MAG: redoxin domain-containing protein [Anaerolineae bacterium]|nr:redoxin domain-containing protein [Anaerolineae bacterium]